MNSLTLVLASSLFLVVRADGHLRSPTRHRKVANLDENAIVGGHLAADTEKAFPYFVYTGTCGGSLVAPDIVLTASHCYPGIRSDVIVGALDYWYEDDKSQRRDVISKVKHPKYNSETQDYDYMLVKIEKVTKPHLKPVELSKKHANPSAGTKLRVIGMGATNRAADQRTHKLHWVDVKALPHKTCTRQYGTIDRQINFCAAAKGKGSCAGDSGGPIINMSGDQVGIVSWGGVPCANRETPSVYASIAGGMDWISSQICSLSDYADPKFCGKIEYGGGGGGDGGGRSPSKAPTKFTSIVVYDELPARFGYYIEDSKKNRIPITPIEISRKKRTEVVEIKPGRSYKLVMSNIKQSGPSGRKKGSINIVGVRKGKRVWKKRILVRFSRTKTVKFTVPKLL